jgi:hypothetical protein
MHPNMRVLTLSHYGETPADDLQVTLNPGSIKMVVAQNGFIQNREIKITTIFFVDKLEPVEFNLSGIELLDLQQVIGAYGFFEG